MVAVEKKSPKLLVLCQLFYPELISTGQTLTELCEELVEMGADIEVVCGPLTIIDQKSKTPKYIEHHGIHIKRVWGARFPKLSLIGRIINQTTYAVSVFFHLLFDNSRRPILVLTNPPFLAVICGLLRLFGGKPYIYLIFDVYPNTAIKLGVLKEKGLISKLWELSNRFTFKHASAIVVIGRCMKEVILKKIGPTIASKIHSIHVWSDDKHIQPVSRNDNPFVKKWNLHNKFVISYSGNMGRFHDMETIMEAVKALNDYADMLFLFVGEGYKKKWCIEFAKKWNLKNCQFHTYVAREDLGTMLSCADIGLVSLLEGQEGLSVPSKTFGIMSAKIPVIGIMSANSEIARILIEEECGLVVKSGDVQGLVNAILSLYNNRWKLELMGGNSRLAVDTKYSLNKAAKAYYELIHNLNIEIFKKQR